MIHIVVHDKGNFGCSLITDYLIVEQSVKLLEIEDK
jgi:hypothetical protein